MRAAADIVEPPSSDEPEMFGKALMELAPPLRRRAYRLTHDPVEADDLLQETLARAWSARLSFRPGTSLKAWTFTILRNLFLAQLRRSYRLVDLDDGVAERIVAIDADQHAKTEFKAVLDAIDLLPTDQRLALTAIALEGLDYVSAAQALNVTQGALKSRVRRARAALARLVEDGVPRSAGEPGQGDEAKPERTAALSAASFRGVWTTAKTTGHPLWIG
ncbi:RNA polymerase sigma factor [Sphingomonas sp. M1A8_2b]